jgi:hypothetical protein
MDALNYNAHLILANNAPPFLELIIFVRSRVGGHEKALKARADACGILFGCLEFYDATQLIEIHLFVPAFCAT